MSRISVCAISVVVALSLWTGGFMTATVCKAEKERIQAVFPDDLDKKYEQIVNERRNHYFYGLTLGVVIALGVSYAFPNLYATRFGRVMGFLAVTYFVAVLFYSVIPKSDYMLNHLKTPEENKAWLRMYLTMKRRYLYGMLLGALAAIPIANSFCA